MDKDAVGRTVDALMGPVRELVWFEMHAEIIEPILKANPGWKWGDVVEHHETTGQLEAVRQEIDRNFKARLAQRLEDEVVKALR